MPQTKGGSLSPPSRVRVATQSAGATTYQDKDGNLTVLQLIDIHVIWGNRDGEQWRGTLVKDPGVLAILEKIKKKSSSQSAKLYASKLPQLIFLDCRYGICDAVIDAHHADSRYVCNAPIVIPGVDGYKCSKCGWIFRGLPTRTASHAKVRREKKVEQVPLDELPSTQLDLFYGSGEEIAVVSESDVIEVWAVTTESDREEASQQLLELYLDD